MTIEEIVGWSVEDIEKLSEQELESACSFFHNITRPSKEQRESFRQSGNAQGHKVKSTKQDIDDMLKQAQILLANFQQEK